MDCLHTAFLLINLQRLVLLIYSCTAPSKFFARLIVAESPFGVSECLVSADCVTDMPFTVQQRVLCSGWLHKNQWFLCFFKLLNLWKSKQWFGNAKKYFKLSEMHSVFASLFILQITLKIGDLFIFTCCENSKSRF